MSVLHTHIYKEKYKQRYIVTNSQVNDWDMESAIKVWVCGFVLKKARNKEKGDKYWWEKNKQTGWDICLFLCLAQVEGDIYWNKKAENPKQIRKMLFHKIWNYSIEIIFTDAFSCCCSWEVTSYKWGRLFILLFSSIIINFKTC